MTWYFLNVAIFITACWLFYKLFLQKETFFTLNRFVLIACLFLSFTLPLVPIPQKLSLQNAAIKQIIPTDKIFGIQHSKDESVFKTSYIKSTNIEQLTNFEQPNNYAKIFNWFKWLYWFGVAALAINFIVQLIILFYYRSKGDVIKDGKMRIVEVKGDQAPCSFGNSIFINPEKYDWNTYEQILTHEKIHIQQKHSIDILLAELLLIFQWFNPFAWLYRKSMVNNLEFDTDDKILKKGNIEKSSYQLSLLQVSAPHFPLNITTNYNQSLLKKRLYQMNAKRSNFHIIWKYFFLIPCLTILVCAFNNPSNEKTAIIMLNDFNIKRINDDTSHIFESIRTRKESILPVPSNPKNNYTDNEKNTDSGINERKKNGGNYQKPSLDKVAINNKIDLSNIEPDEDYIRSLAEVGYQDLSNSTMVLMKKSGVTADFIRSFWRIGLPGKISTANLIALKNLNVTAEYYKEFIKIGYTFFEFGDVFEMKRLGVTPDYILSFRGIGFPEISLNMAASLKKHNITPAIINEYRTLGLGDISLNEIVTAVETGTTPEFIFSHQKKGVDFKNVKGFINLKLK